MKILMVGSDKVYAIENFYKKYLEELGEKIELFTAQNYFYDYYQKSILNKLLYRASLSGISGKINGLFKKVVAGFEPDIIWIFKGMEISPASLRWAKSRNIKLVNYNPDNPFIFSGRGSGNRNVTNSIPIYDLHFTYNLEVQRKLERDYHAVTVFLPFGFDLDIEVFESAKNQPEILKLCFAGNPDKERSAFIEHLAASGINVDLYGHDWARFIKNPGVTIYQPVYGTEFWQLLRRYRVQLNLMREHNINSHNMRTFEIPAVGGIMLAPDTPEHRMFYEDRKQVFLFGTIDECIQLANTILGLSAAVVEKIREDARIKSLSSGYCYKERADIVLQALKKLVA
jgi:spore maturation protein CgeB